MAVYLKKIPEDLYKSLLTGVRLKNHSLKKYNCFMTMNSSFI